MNNERNTVSFEELNEELNKKMELKKSQLLEGINKSLVKKNFLADPWHLIISINRDEDNNLIANITVELGNNIKKHIEIPHILYETILEECKKIDLLPQFDIYNLVNPKQASLLKTIEQGPDYPLGDNNNPAKLTSLSRDNGSRQPKHTASSEYPSVDPPNDARY